MWNDILKDITDVNIKNHSGKTALQIYLTDNYAINQEVVKALLRKRAVLDGLTEAQLAKISVARDQLAYEEKLEYHKHK
jgi:hypothetical protein